MLGGPGENTTSLGSQVPLVGHTRQGIQGLRLWEPWKGGASGFHIWEYEFWGAGEGYERQNSEMVRKILGPHETHTSALIILLLKGFLEV